jgi:integrase/recombinase XerD
MNTVDLLESWELALRAQHKSPKTLRHYIGGVQAWLRWCETTGTAPELTKTNVQKFIAGLFERGCTPGTARARYSSLRRFSAWLVAEGEVPSDIFKDMTPPQLDTKALDPLTEAELRDLIKVCAGKDFRSRRDEAVIRLMNDSGIRSAECVSLTMDDLDLARGLAVVVRGKGGKGRVVSFGPETAAALDRYKRVRADHKLAGRPNFWLGERGNLFSYHTLFRLVKHRAELAGIQGRMHPHRLRGTWATRWLDAGGSESGLMSQAGWSSSDMLRRYTAATAASRSADEAKRLALGSF